MTEHRVGVATQIPKDAPLMVDVDGRRVGIFRFRDRLYAFENRCLHQGGPVCFGEITAQVVVDVAADGAVGRERVSEHAFNLVCPWHGWEYDLETGECVADRRLSLHRYGVVERDGHIFLLSDSH